LGHSRPTPYATGPVFTTRSRLSDDPRPASLVVQTSFLGDVVLTTPLLRELARRGPVDVVVRPDAAAILSGHPDVRRVVVYDKRGRDAGLGRLWRLARLLRAGGPYAAAYMAQGSPRSAALALLAGCRERVGFDSSRQARPLYTRVVRFRRDRHHAERRWALACPDAEPDAAAIRPRLQPHDDERAMVDALLGTVPAIAADPAGFVTVAPGSVWATKRWPFYPELAALLADAWPVVVVGGPGDRELAAAIVAACPPARALDATGRLSLLASAELLGRARLLVTNDSAPLHLASAVGTPTLAVFGPTVPAFGFGPLAPGSGTAGVDDLACRPCDAHGPRVCPLGHWRCMREQAPAAMAARVRAMLAAAG
jgi:heptosyltransferase-2